MGKVLARPNVTISVERGAEDGPKIGRRGRLYGRADASSEYVHFAHLIGFANGATIFDARSSTTILLIFDLGFFGSTGTLPCYGSLAYRSRFVEFVCGRVGSQR